MSLVVRDSGNRLLKPSPDGQGGRQAGLTLHRNLIENDQSLLGEDLFMINANPLAKAVPAVTIPPAAIRSRRHRGLQPPRISDRRRLQTAERKDPGLNTSSNRAASQGSHRPRRRLAATVVITAAALEFSALPASAGAAATANASGITRKVGALPQIKAATRPEAGAVRLSTRQRQRLLDQAADAAQDTARSLNLGPHEKVIPKDVIKDADGTIHTRYERTYAGLPETDDVDFLDQKRVRALPVQVQGEPRPAAHRARRPVLPRRRPNPLVYVEVPPEWERIAPERYEQAIAGLPSVRDGFLEARAELMNALNRKGLAC
ncbi:hypothetical protein [Streptomyces sp900116325]|uniref:hypothetical protein n=1 Tax=Streptomyces sp. 900116325 TaxID=3154295 RepID=UPI0033B054C6